MRVSKLVLAAAASYAASYEIRRNIIVKRTVTVSASDIGATDGSSSVVASTQLSTSLSTTSIAISTSSSTTSSQFVPQAFVPPAFVPPAFVPPPFVPPPQVSSSSTTTTTSQPVNGGFAPPANGGFAPPVQTGSSSTSSTTPPSNGGIVPSPSNGGIAGGGAAPGNGLVPDSVTTPTGTAESHNTNNPTCTNGPTSRLHIDETSSSFEPVTANLCGPKTITYYRDSHGCELYSSLYVSYVYPDWTYVRARTGFLCGISQTSIYTTPACSLITKLDDDDPSHASTAAWVTVTDCPKYAPDGPDAPKATLTVTCPVLTVVPNVPTVTVQITETSTKFTNIVGATTVFPSPVSYCSIVSSDGTHEVGGTIPVSYVTSKVQVILFTTSTQSVFFRDPTATRQSNENDGPVTVPSGSLTNVAPSLSFQEETLPTPQPQQQGGGNGQSQTQRVSESGQSPQNGNGGNSGAPSLPNSYLAPGNVVTATVPIPVVIPVTSVFSTALPIPTVVVFQGSTFTISSSTVLSVNGQQSTILPSSTLVLATGTAFTISTFLPVAESNSDVVPVVTTVTVLTASAVLQTITFGGSTFTLSESTTIAIDGSTFTFVPSSTVIISSSIVTGVSTLTAAASSRGASGTATVSGPGRTATSKAAAISSRVIVNEGSWLGLLLALAIYLGI